MLKMMDNPKFTVIIPTRERADTLLSALRTCTTQSYEYLEIIVSDNFSQDTTHAVVDSFADARIRYLNTGRRLGMSANWEFAAAQATGDYVGFIGDDDGLLPDAIESLALLLVKSDAPDAIFWNRPAYCWPNHILTYRRNTLGIKPGTGISMRSSSESVQRVIDYKSSWGTLPSVYNGFVKSKILRAIKDKSLTHRLFSSPIPDVYSAIAVSAMTDLHLFSRRPYSLAGVSSHSTGESQSNPLANRKASDLFFSENEIHFHKQIKPTAVSSAYTTECILQAWDDGLLGHSCPINMKSFIRAALLEASELSEASYRLVLQDIRDIADMNGLRDFVESEIRGSLHSPPIKCPTNATGWNLRSGLLNINCDDFHVANVFDAAALCKKLLDSDIRITAPLGTLINTVQAWVPFVRKRAKRMVAKLVP